MEYLERKKLYEKMLAEMLPQMAEILASGYFLEVGKSRSGLKLFKVTRKHEVVRRSNLKHGAEGDSANDI